MLSIVEDKLEDYQEDLGYEDMDSNNVLTIEQIKECWRLARMPELKDERLEFFDTWQCVLATHLRL